MDPKKHIEKFIGDCDSGTTDLGVLHVQYEAWCRRHGISFLCFHDFTKFLKTFAKVDGDYAQVTYNGRDYMKSTSSSP